jgi:multicomponent Na+:H+ antiporter subunit F
MNDFLISVGVVLLALMIPILFRVVRGPTVIDRMIGANIIGAKTTVLLLLIGTLYHRLDMFVDLALTYALLNYIGSLASARFIQRRKTAAPEPVTEETSLEMEP